MATEHSDDFRLLAYRVDQNEKALSEIRDAVKSIDKSFQLLSVVMAKHAMTIKDLMEVAKRVHGIEEELPTMKLARKWVLTAMTAGSAAVGAGVVALVMR